MHKNNSKSNLLLVSLSNEQNISVRRHLYEHLKSKYKRVIFVGDGNAGDDFDFINWKLSSKRSMRHTIASFFRLTLIFFSSRPSHVISFAPKANLFCNLLQRFFGFKHCSIVTGLGELFNLLNTSSFIATAVANLIYPKNSFWITMNDADCSILGHRRGVFREVYDIPGEGYSLKFNEIDYLNRGRFFDVVYISRIIESKGVFEFLEAIKILRNRGIYLNAAVVGRIDLPPILFDKFSLYASDLALKNYGYLSEKEKNEILLNSKVLVLPTKYGEGLPFSLLEAQDAGCSIVTSMHPGCARALSPDKVNFVSEVVPEAIADLIRVALNKFEHMTPDEISQSRDWIAARHSPDATLRAYDKIFSAIGFY